MIDPKLLKKLAKACREAGIKSYKCPEFEFTLTDEAPVTQSRAASSAQPDADNKFESDSLTPEDLLFYSVGTSPEDDAGAGRIR